MDKVPWEMSRSSWYALYHPAMNLLHFELSLVQKFRQKAEKEFF